MFEMITVACFINNEAFHIPEVAFEIRKFAISECGVIAFSYE